MKISIKIIMLWWIQVIKVNMRNMCSKMEMIIIRLTLISYNHIKNQTNILNQWRKNIIPIKTTINFFSILNLFQNKKINSQEILSLSNNRPQKRRFKQCITRVRNSILLLRIFLFNLISKMWRKMNSTSKRNVHLETLNH